MIKIVTDSTAYLPKSTIQQYDLRVVPLYVHFADEGFREGVELSDEEFYTRLKQAPELPTTSQPSAGEFLRVFKALAGDGHEIITITISSKLSGTWNSAMAARDMLPEANITVIDSEFTSVGLQMMVEAAAQAAQAGASVGEIVDQIQTIRKKMHFMFVVDTLEYLAKGGRIGNAKAFMGTLLKVKPILVLQDGAIEPLEQVRSKRKAHCRMLDLVAEGVDGQGAQAHVAFTNALVQDEARELAQQLQDRLGCPPPLVSDLGPVIGTHTGPGAVGVAYYL